MAQLLDYAQDSQRRRRRRRLIFGITAMVITTSCVLAVPRFKAFQERQNQRAAIRQQFETQLAIAQHELDQRNVDDAALALFRAEFPTRTEGGLFWRSEVESFDRRTEQARVRLSEVNVVVQKEREARAKAQRDREEREDAEGRANVIRCCFGNAVPRQKTIDALESRAAEQLKNSNNRQARGICEQIMLLDPVHRFGKDFWANIPQ